MSDERPKCFGSGPGPKAAAENCCHACQHQAACAIANPTIVDGIAAWVDAELAHPVGGLRPMKFDPRPAPWHVKAWAKGENSHVQDLERYQHFANEHLSIPWDDDPIGSRLILACGPWERELRDGLKRVQWRGGVDLSKWRQNFRFCFSERDVEGRRDFLALAWGGARMSRERAEASRLLMHQVTDGQGRWLDDVISKNHPLQALIAEVRR